MVKTTRFMLAFLFTFVFVIGMGSAFTQSTSTLTFANPETSSSVSFTGVTGSNYTLSFPTITILDRDNNAVTFNIVGSNSITGAQTIVWNISSSNIDYSKFVLGKDYSTIVNFNATRSFLNASNETETEILQKSLTTRIENTYCRYGNQGNLIKIDSIEDRSSGDDWEWEPLKVVKIRVEVENRDTSKRSITTKLALYDSAGKSVWLSLDEKEIEETIRIASEDDARFEFEFTLPADLKRNEDYTLYVKAYDKESDQCISSSQEIEIDTDKEVIMDELEIPSVLFCGETNTISLKLYNLDLGDEEEMRVNLYSKDLGLNLFSDQFELDEGDNEYVYFDFSIPTGTDTKSYKITFYTEYDYKESSDSYRKNINLGTYTVSVGGDKCKAKASPTINATLDSETETKVGEDLVVRILIKNPLETSSFIVALEGYDSWASSATLDVSSFNLNKDGTKTVTATFKPKEAGTQEFTIQAIYGGEVIKQKVTVDVEESSNWFSKIRESLNGNLTFWLTIAIFIVLILIIVVFLVRFAGSKRSE